MAFLCGASPIVYAQTPPVAVPPQAPLIVEGSDEDLDDLSDAIRQLKNIPIKSLFFSAQEIRYVRMAQQVYFKKQQNPASSDFDESEFLKKFGTIKTETQVTVFTYPQFFLHAVVFRSDTDWAVWINDDSGKPSEKITHDSPQEKSDIKVLEVADNKVTFLWRPVMMDKVMEVWRRTPNEQVKVDEKEGTVIFTLHPNQTFTSFLMKIIEGKVKPMTIGNDASANISAANNPSDPSPNNSPLALPKDQSGDDNQGLSGLLRMQRQIKPVFSEPPSGAANQPATRPAMPAPPPVQKLPPTVGSQE